MYVSPWQWSPYRGAVAAIRALLRACGIDETGFVQRLVEENNRRVTRHLARHGAGTVLLILPRCVKRACCKLDPEGSLDGCLDCHDCDLGVLARIAAAHEVRALVAFRSHIAYEMARRERPDLIIATACEDRLVKALRSVPEIPAVLAPLTDMERMCVNASFEPAWFEAQIALAVGAAGGERHVSCAHSGS
jgi:hypothetical protein